MVPRLATPQAKMLHDALIALGVDAKLEYNDGHKTVDIAVLPAKLYIEVDGGHHFTNPDQIERDFKRFHFSDGDDFNTFYVTNHIVELHCEKVAKALAEVVRRRTTTK